MKDRHTDTQTHTHAHTDTHAHTHTHTELSFYQTQISSINTIRDGNYVGRPEHHS